MNWIKITDKLPEIPKGKYGIPVLVVKYDPIYDESDDTPPKSRGKGCTTRDCHYGIVDSKMKMFPKELIGTCQFMEISVSPAYKYGYEWTPVFEQITHWMYFPEPPKYDTRWNEEKELLEYVYAINYTCPNCYYTKDLLLDDKKICRVCDEDMVDSRCKI